MRYQHKRMACLLQQAQLAQTFPITATVCSVVYISVLISLTPHFTVATGTSTNFYPESSETDEPSDAFREYKDDVTDDIDTNPSAGDSSPTLDIQAPIEFLTVYIQLQLGHQQISIPNRRRRMNPLMRSESIKTTSLMTLTPILQQVTLHLL